jgi:hypothetical protein
VTSAGADPAAAAGQPDPSGKGPASDAQNSDHPIPAIVDVADQGALGKADSGTVRVEYVADTHADVLTVPVEALVALGEGGFGLEIRGGGTPRVVAVKVGLFGGGQVEVSGDGIAEGTTVGVAG